MVNYSNGKIYKIEALDGDDGDIYIGSTTKKYLSQRMDSHRSNYKSWLNGIGTKISAYDIFDKYGIDNCKIYLLEKVNCKSNDELVAREGFYVKSMTCVNKNIPGRNIKEWYMDNKTRLKDKYESNKDDILVQRKIYHANNKDKIKMRRGQECVCVCGSIHKRGDLAKHLRTLKHNDYLTHEAWKDKYIRKQLAELNII